jgi:hypothetical protein
MSDASSNEHEQAVTPELNVAPLSDTDTQLLTQARSASWQLEQYEYAYDATVRALSFYQTLTDFLGVFIAVLFLFIQSGISEKYLTLQWVVGYLGTGLSLVVIFAAIWAAYAQWKSKIEKMQKLSTEARELLKTHQRLSSARPIEHAKIQKWLIDCLSFEELRKEPLTSVPSLSMKRGFQHVGNRYMGRGVVCGICNQEWKHDSNKKARWSWVPFRGCSGCGV